MNVLRFARALLFDALVECSPDDGMDANVALDAYVRWLRIAMRDDGMLGALAPPLPVRAAAAAAPAPPLPARPPPCRLPPQQPTLQERHPALSQFEFALRAYRHDGPDSDHLRQALLGPTAARRASPLPRPARRARPRPTHARATVRGRCPTSRASGCECTAACTCSATATACAPRAGAPRQRECPSPRAASPRARRLAAGSRRRRVPACAGPSRAPTSAAPSTTRSSCACRWTRACRRRRAATRRAAAPPTRRTAASRARGGASTGPR